MGQPPFYLLYHGYSCLSIFIFKENKTDAEKRPFLIFTIIRYEGQPRGLSSLPRLQGSNR